MLRYITFLAIMVLPVGLSGCIYDNPGSFRGGNFETEKRVVDHFHSLELDGYYSVRIENSDSCSLKVSADEDIMDMIITEVRNGVLIVRTVEQTRFGSHNSVDLVIKAPTLERIKVMASAEIFSGDTFVFDELRIESSGALKMDINFKGNLLEGNFAGATDLNLRGEVQDVNLNLPGAGKISAYDLLVGDLNLRMAGTGKAEVFASKQLDVDLSGACIVSYKGEPAKVFTNISGIGRVREAN